MLQRLIDDMNHALDANCYLSALSIALMLPDICGKAAYPEKKVGERYKDWYDEYVGKYEKCPVPAGHENEPIMPYLSGEVIYSLRNSFLHQGTPNIEVSKISQPENKIDYFALVIQSKNQFDVYSDRASIVNGTVRFYQVNIRRLCLILGSTASGYYRENKDKFSFFNYTLIDKDMEMSKLKSIGF